MKDLEYEIKNDYLNLINNLEFITMIFMNVLIIY